MASVPSSSLPGGLFVVEDTEAMAVHELAALLERLRAAVDAMDAELRARDRYFEERYMGRLAAGGPWPHESKARLLRALRPRAWWRELTSPFSLARDVRRVLRDGADTGVAVGAVLPDVDAMPPDLRNQLYLRHVVLPTLRATAKGRATRARNLDARRGRTSGTEAGDVRGL